MVPLGSDCRDLTTTEDPAGRNRPRRLELLRLPDSIVTEGGTEGTSSANENPEPTERGMTFSLGGSAKERQAGDDSTETLEAEEETDLGVSVLGKPSKLPIESSSPNNLSTELE